MNIKIFLLTISLLLQITWCTGSSEKKLKISMWADMIPKEVYQKFEKETGIKIIEDAISSNEEIFTKVKTSSEGYDIVTPSLDYASIMLREGLLTPIDKDKIPNITNIDPNIMKSLQIIDPNSEYIIPFAFGPTVIGYDTSVIDEEITGFDIFLNPKYKGKMTLLNDMREVMGSAFLYLGYSIDESDPEALAKVASLLNSWKENILRFDSDSFQIAYANGEIDIVHGYPDTIIPNLSKNKRKNTKFILPKKGGIIWIDSFLILKNSQNKDEAMEFINFIHRPEIYAKVIDHIELLSLNIPARELIKTKPYIDYEELNKMTMLCEIDDAILVKQARIWENIQAQ